MVQIQAAEPAWSRSHHLYPVSMTRHYSGLRQRRAMALVLSKVQEAEEPEAHQNGSGGQGCC